jgi:hypothetical protein
MFSPLTLDGLLSVALLLGWFGKLDLARAGQSDYAIVQSASPTAAEGFAAEDLSAHLQKITGARFAVLPETAAAMPPCAIYVGWTDFARRQGIDVTALGDDEWVIKSCGKNLVLTGGRPRGTLFAVYEFLEQQLGCHWFDEFTETIPARAGASVSARNARHSVSGKGRSAVRWLTWRTRWPMGSGLTTPTC